MPYESRTFRSLSGSELAEYEAAFTRVLRAAVDRARPDLIHTHHVWLLSSLARRLFPGIPMVASCHGSDLRQFRQCPHLQDHVLVGCRSLDGVLALTREQRLEVVELYGIPAERVSVAGAGYDDRLFTQGLKQPGNPVDLVYAGKLSRSKGVPYLLDALRRLDGPQWRLHLAGGGTGEEAEECLRRARDLGSRVLIHGPMTHAALADLMRQAHILVLPSLYEGLGLVILEGIASGCRIVTTKLPGVQEVLGDVTADYISLVAPPRRHAVDIPVPEDAERFVSDLASALRAQVHAASRDPNIDLSPLKNRLTEFSWHGVFRRVNDVYFSIANR